MNWRIPLLTFCCLVIPYPPASAASTGKAMYQRYCSGCHDVANSRIPSRETLQRLSPNAIVDALESGAMRAQGSKLTPEERRLIAQFLTGKTLGANAQASAKSGLCNSAKAFSIAPGEPEWNGWGAGLSNRRFQSANAALSASEIPKLKLKWAFGFANDLAGCTQPTIVGGRVFVGSVSGKVFALDAKTGCTYWSFHASAGVRSAISVAQIGNPQPPRYAAFFGDLHANVYAVDASTGQLIWKTPVDSNPLAGITGAPAFYDGRLYVPVSSFEEAVANPDDVCCTFRGSVLALDAATGSHIWQTYTISETARPTGKDSAVTQRWGPSGAAVWSAPTIDPEGKAIYVATGDNYSDPPTDTSDAVLALDMDDGHLTWKRQFTSGDAFNVGCMLANKAKCPKEDGPDSISVLPPFSFRSVPAEES